VSYTYTYRADKSDHLRIRCDCGSERILVTDRRSEHQMSRELECQDCGKTEQAKHVQLDTETRSAT
jgi:hypothetical protein